MTVTRVGKELISLKPELFADRESLITLARRTQGKLGLNKIADYERFAEACIKDLFSLEWIPSRSDERVGYIKLRPVAGEMIDMMDELRALPLLRRHRLKREQSMRVYKVIKRSLVLKRPKVIDFIIKNANQPDRPVDPEVFAVWVDDICLKNKQPMFNSEEKREMAKSWSMIRKALKIYNRPAPKPKKVEVEEVTETSNDNNTIVQVLDSSAAEDSTEVEQATLETTTEEDAAPTAEEVNSVIENEPVDVGTAKSIEKEVDIVGRGLTSPYLQIDEGPFIDHIQTVITAASIEKDDASVSTQVD